MKGIVVVAGLAAITVVGCLVTSVLDNLKALSAPKSAFELRPGAPPMRTPLKKGVL